MEEWAVFVSHQNWEIIGYSYNNVSLYQVITKEGPKVIKLILAFLMCIGCFVNFPADPYYEPLH